MRSSALALVLFVIGLTLAAVAAGPSRPITPSGAQNRGFAQSTQAPGQGQQGPTLGQVQSEEASMSTPGPAAVYAEDLPDYPDPAAADPYTNSPGQNQQI